VKAPESETTNFSVSLVGWQSEESVMAGAEVYPAAVMLTLASARKIIEGALEKASTEGAMPLAVVVLDGGGNTVAMERQDGAGAFRPDVALAKAWGALGFGVPSGVLGERLAGREGFQSALAAASGGTHEDVQLLADRVLSHVVCQRAWPDGPVQGFVLRRGGGGHESVGLNHLWLSRCLVGGDVPVSSYRAAPCNAMRISSSLLRSWPSSLRIIWLASGGL
jgi:uncharacterized protein GlcG (DUF336 family)